MVIAEEHHAITQTAVPAPRALRLITRTPAKMPKAHFLTG
jgi:hypothetical protein